MFFLDSAGFFSIVSLIAQCGLCWTFVVLFSLLGARLERPLWLQRWSKAFLALAVALTAVLVRFLLAHHHIAGDDVLAEGAPLTRCLYAIYSGGKLTFLWFLLGGTAALRELRFPRFRWVGLPITVVAALMASLLPTVEWHLLVQAPLFAGTSTAAWWLLGAHARARGDAGSRVVRFALLAWAALWLLYAIASAQVGPTERATVLPWSLLLRLNSLFDLLLQSTLAFGLVVLVLQDAQHRLASATAERDRLREQVQRDERLRAMSTLVGGVAHELNNPLTAILGFTEDLEADDAATRRSAAQVVREQAERCCGIVRRLSTMAGAHSVLRTPVRVPNLLERVVRGLGPQLAQAALHTELHVAPDLPLVDADATAIEQVLTNLITNAMHASPPGGSIRITAAVDDAGVAIAVEDQGAGVPEAIRARLFEPFFTTKPPGQGTGLGLPVALSLVRAHGGSIEVGQVHPHGARFVVHLPASVAVPVPQPGAAPAAAAPSRRLLVVDDEPLVRDTLARHARRRGWQVDEADSGLQALARLQSGQAGYDAVLCDLRMPGLSGIELHDRLLAEQPQLLSRFVFVTGDPASTATQAFAARCTAPLVGKPFEFPELFAALELAAQRSNSSTATPATVSSVPATPQSPTRAR